MNYRTDKSCVVEMDSEDPLSKYRARFYIPKQKNGEDCVYLCGHSLGLQPKSVRSHIEQILRDWAALGVEGWFHAKNPWVIYDQFLVEQTARLVGAKPIEVVLMNSLTVNLHLMMFPFYKPTPSRNKVLIEYRAFSSDQYAVKSQIRFHGFDPRMSLVEVHPRGGGEAIIRTEDIESLIEKEGGSIALIMLGGINYYTGQAFDMERITRIGHSKGCLVGFDLAHAVGNIVLKLHDWNLDFAVWCTYKYLNSGPGSIAGCFIHEKHSNNSELPRFAGWWGHNKKTRFLMPPDFEPIEGAEGWQLSTPPILQMAALRASMEMFDEVGMEKLKAKSDLLTGYLEFLIDEIKSESTSIITPRDIKKRGCQLSIYVQRNGKLLYDKLTAQGVICDWREPGVIRVAPVPFYNTFMDVYKFCEILKTNVE